MTSLMFDRVLNAPLHCVKSVRIRSFSGPCFPAFGLNIWTPYLSIFSPNAGEFGPEKFRIRKLSQSPDL